MKAEYDSYSFDCGGRQVTGSNWMSFLPDDMALSDVTIPGTHDSATAQMETSGNGSAQCQQLSIYDQLRNGIRYFDLRLGRKLAMIHGKMHFFCKYKGEILHLPQVMDWVLQFLRENPRETVVLQVKVDYHMTQNVEGLAYDYFKDLLSKRPDKFYIGDHIPSLSECRGKAVIISRLERDSSDFQYDGTDDQWAIDADNWAAWTKDASDPMARTVSTDSYEIWTQDIHTELGNDKWNIINNSVFSTSTGAEAKQAQVKEEGKDGWSISYTSCVSIAAPVKYPQTAAREINPMLIQKLQSDDENLVNGQYLGVVCSDFSSQQLAYLIYRQNFHDLKAVTVKGVDSKGRVIDQMTQLVARTTPLSEALDLDQIRAYFTKDGYRPYGDTIGDELLRRIPMNQMHSEAEYRSQPVHLEELYAYNAPVLYVALETRLNEKNLFVGFHEPVCNTTITLPNGSWASQQPQAYVQILNSNFHFVQENGTPKAFWRDGDGHPLEGTVTGGSTVYLYVEIEADWGYYFAVDGETPRVSFTGTTGETAVVYAAVVDSTHLTSQVSVTVVHRRQLIPDTPPTCTESGWWSHHVCPDCGMLFRANQPERTISYDEVVQGSRGHDFGDWVEAASAGETEGVEKRTCRVCGAEETRSIPAAEHVHHMAYVEPRNAGCVEEGSTGYWLCADCGRYFADEDAMTEMAKDDAVIPALGHAWVSMTFVWSEDGTSVTASRVCMRDHAHDETETAPINETVLQEATCTEDGAMQRTVAFENETFSVAPVTITLPALGHDWVQNHVITAPTCMAAGEAYYICGHDASHNRTDVLPATGHTPVASEIVSDTATCEEDGTRTWETRCTVCREVLASAIEDSPAHGHAWGEATYTWEDDNSFVMAQHHCTYNPSHGESEVVAATWVDEPATCEEYGLRGWFSEPFSFDGFIIQEKDVEILEPLGHDWGEWVVTLEPRTSTFGGQIHGQETRTCQRDASHQQRRVLPYPGHQHTLTTVAAVSPTCEEAGSIAHWICSGSGLPCFRYFSDASGNTELEEEALVLPPLGHAWSDWSAEIPANYSEEGVETRSCLHDETHKEIRFVDPDPDSHVWARAQVHRKASATEAGSKTQICTLNEAHTETVDIPVLTVTAPEARQLDLSGEAQALIVPGAASSGEGVMRYALGSADGPTEAYAAAVPAAAEAGAYTFWYMVPEDDEHVQWGPEKLVSYIVPTFDTADLSLPAQLAAIEESAFEGLGLIRAVDARSCAAIGAGAFRNCEHLTQIRLPKDCSIDPAAFDPGVTVFVYAPAGGATEAFCLGIASCVFVPAE